MASKLEAIALQYKDKPLEHLTALLNHLDLERIEAEKAITENSLPLLEVVACDMRIIAREIEDVTAAQIYPGMCDLDATLKAQIVALKKENFELHLLVFGMKMAQGKYGRNEAQKAFDHIVGLFENALRPKKKK